MNHRVVVSQECTLWIMKRRLWKVIEEGTRGVGLNVIYRDMVVNPICYQETSQLQWL